MEFKSSQQAANGTHLEPMVSRQLYPNRPQWTPITPTGQMKAKGPMAKGLLALIRGVARISFVMEVLQYHYYLWLRNC